MFTAVTKLGFGITVTMTAACMAAGPAAARPGADLRQAPPQTCSESIVSAGTATYIPVAGDPTAYQKCGPAGPVGIKHCPTGAVFDSATDYCVAQKSSDATLGVDAVWQEGDGSACESGCAPKPIKVRLTYSGNSVGMASVTLVDPAAPGSSWGGSANTLTGDGQTHSVVITTNKLVPTAADWVLKPGASVSVQAYLTDGKANPDGDPTTSVATVTQVVTATTKPSGSDSATA
ncbi:hypothetical protein FZI85_23655 [Mycobacterium sp. CBMA293]|uniref:hypothetical protein n=1 Tax=unclassified Mycolicibacterium TaxID=2636767 RepID=UPI0012DF7897|nr:MULTISPECIES: hypothetical protein [unclassified Mycolicibacterium]MUL45742.1 hypothetical protein [Mycolicibacterium sp. CBMA 360]MUL60413.1 hypothetical protein [Mycolicibacterium sp. CBMA 335]MUL72228.1 hypothetical protein [Mycolicibacterium sp. CBMA 311]MUL95371.1 hypothetical protein [Mycolicibacterium sp. CBMA 230]MUM06809.1 hypothetical protein [Mycolicibacterium sp. CBMA 213]